jgi:cytochrome c-type biogenesis protein CcmH
MLLFLFATLLVAAVGYALARPLLRPLAPPDAASAFNTAVYRDQLKELEREVARGVLPEGEAAAARTEIERRLLAAASGADASSSEAKPSRTAAALVALAIAVGAGGVYLAIGDPGAPDQPLQARKGAEKSIAGGDPMHGQMEDLVRQLAQKLEENPGDPQGWALMARSLMRLERPAEAVDAYKRAIDLSGGRDGTLAGEYAEARIVAGGGRVDAEAESIYRQMLREEPGNPQARYYLAFARLQRGDRAGALADWQQLLADTPADAPWRETLERQIAEAGGAAPRGPTASDMKAAAGMSEADRSAMIEGMVSQLAARLKDNPDDLEGWRRLARAYDVLGRGDEAARAHERVLALSPNDPAALWSLGQRAKARGDIAGARRRWEALERTLPKDAPERVQVRQALADLR